MAGNDTDDTNRLPENLRLSPAAIERLDRLFDSVPPHELRENLLEIYHTYLIYVHDSLPIDFDRIARNMYLLNNCLATLSNEASQDG